MVSKKKTPGKSSSKQQPGKKEPSAKPQPQDADFPIVGIGASAGGLEALEAFFSHVPTGCGVAFIVVQHLDPTHKSIMASLLKKYTPMDIAEISDGATVEKIFFSLFQNDRLPRRSKQRCLRAAYHKFDYMLN